MKWSFQWCRLIFAVLLTLPIFGETWQTKHGGTFDASVKSLEGGHATFEAENGRKFSMKTSDLRPESRARLINSLTRSTSSEASVTNHSPRAQNLGGSWPREIRNDAPSRVKVIKEDKAGRYFEYESSHYRFISSIRINESVLRSFSVLFETTYQYCQKLPLSLEKSGFGRAKLTVYLFENQAQYVQEGGPPGSAGCYVHGRDIVLVPLSSLGLVWRTGGHVLDRSKQNLVLVHELVHQLTPPAYFMTGARGWFAEGLAEYVSASPYQWGYFQNDSHGRAAKSYVTSHGLNGKGGSALGSIIHAPSLRELMTMPYSTFSGKNASVNYAMGLLCVHYFFHMDGQGDARRITSYLKALNEGEPEPSALSALLNGRSYEELQKDMAAAWKAKGVEIQFGS